MFKLLGKCEHEQPRLNIKSEIYLKLNTSVVIRE